MNRLDRSNNNGDGFYGRRRDEAVGRKVSPSRLAGAASATGAAGAVSAAGAAGAAGAVGAAPSGEKPVVVSANGEQCKSEGGRPRALDRAAKGVVLRSLVRGLSLTEAAALIDCHPRTIQRERERDGEFHDDLRRAEAVALCEPKETVAAAAKTDWRAAAFLMRHAVTLADRRARARKERENRQRATTSNRIASGGESLNVKLNRSESEAPSSMPGGASN